MIRVVQLLIALEWQEIAWESQTHTAAEAVGTSRQMLCIITSKDQVVWLLEADRCLCWVRRCTCLVHAVHSEAHCPCQRMKQLM